MQVLVGERLSVECKVACVSQKTNAVREVRTRVCGKGAGVEGDDVCVCVSVCLSISLTLWSAVTWRRTRRTGGRLFADNSCTLDLADRQSNTP